MYIFVRNPSIFATRYLTHLSSSKMEGFQHPPDPQMDHDDLPEFSMSNPLLRPPSKWISVALRPPGKCTGSPIMLNNNEFVLPIGEHQMVKYNAPRNEWSLFLTMEKPLKFEEGALVIDTDIMRLYASCSRSDITIVDLESESIVYRDEGHKTGYGYNAGMVCVDGVVHKVGGTRCIHHVTWGPKYKVCCCIPLLLVAHDVMDASLEHDVKIK